MGRFTGIITIFAIELRQAAIGARAGIAVRAGTAAQPIIYRS